MKTKCESHKIINVLQLATQSQNNYIMFLQRDYNTRYERNDLILGCHDVKRECAAVEYLVIRPEPK